MPPKKRTTAAAPKSHQSTLAFHGASNKVTKPGLRSQGKNLDSADVPATVTIKSETKPDVDLLDTTEKEASIEPPEAVIVKQEQEVEKKVVILPATPEEQAARKISDAQVKKYWAAKEKLRQTPRVHQEDISLHEKILREFDMSGQFGPCTGIARLKRWNRAQRLGLSPPAEVLAVLLKEQEGENKSTVQRSHVDELLNSRNVPPLVVEN